MRCGAVTKAGKRCKAHATKGRKLCIFHENVQVRAFRDFAKSRMKKNTYRKK